MRRPSKNSGQKLSADSQRLATFAHAIVLASSRLEERGWEKHIDALLQKLLKNDHPDIIDAALDHLFKGESIAYDVLMEAVEAASASCIIEHDGAQYDALLIAAPILAWTRFAIPSGAIAADLLLTLSAHLDAHVLAPNARLTMAPTLFAIDQLPRTYAESFAMTQRMAQAVLKGTPLRAPAALPETAPFLADTRYLLAAVVVPSGAPLFRWQESLNLADRDSALTQWRAQAMPTIERLLPGCGIDLLLPEAYYVACREADKHIRPVSISAAVHYLTHALDIEPDQLNAVIGGFGEESAEGRIDEYRIGFTLDQNPDVIYGIVWPLYGQEDAEQELINTLAEATQATRSLGEAELKAPIEEILTLLKDAGIIHIKQHTERFPMEFCDDCGAPFFCDREAELVHAEMPEDAPHTPSHLH